jgi:hypothetical protein
MEQASVVQKLATELGAAVEVVRGEAEALGLDPTAGEIPEQTKEELETSVLVRMAELDPGVDEGPALGAGEIVELEVSNTPDLEADLRVLEVEPSVEDGDEV